MSGAARRAQAWLGSGEDWGLSPARLSEIGAELDDHLSCLQSDEGLPAAKQARTDLRNAASRRKLAAPHLTDQVYATLNRWPTRREWRELIFLLVCFAAILLSDWLALYVGGLMGDYRFLWGRDAPPPPGAGACALATAAWLLQGLGRAAFFAGFAYTLWRAWRLGWGVLLARIIQLKLIHTVLVVASLMLLGRALWQDYFVGYGYEVSWPLWLSAPLILAALLILGLAFAGLTRGRYWAAGLCAVMLGLFLYTGGPLVANELQVTRPIAVESRISEAGTCYGVPSTDPDKIARNVEATRKYRPETKLDIAANQMTFRQWRLDPLLGAWTERGRYNAPGWSRPVPYWQNLLTEDPTGNRAMIGPVVVAGGGISWLALPIPLLGLLGLGGLILIMGRRGPAELLLYTTLCVVALGATLVPFLLGTPSGRYFEFTVRGVMHSPVPGFEMLLISPIFDWGWISIVGGLVLSAGVPWLLTGLFLRPNRSALPPVDELVAE